MSSRRVLKAAQAIREVVSMAIIAELKDPRIADVTVTFVEVSGDLRHAKVHVSVMGDDTKQRLCLKGLQSSAGYLQKKVGNRIDTRYTPRLHFELDKGLEHSMLVTKILEEVLPHEDNSDPSTDSEPPSIELPIAEAPIAEAPTNEAPSNEAPSNEAPTNEAPSNEVPPTELPTAESTIQEKEDLD